MLCRKVRYQNHDEAIRHWKDIGFAGDGKKFYTYRCAECGRIHISTNELKSWFLWDIARAIRKEGPYHIQYVHFIAKVSNTLSLWEASKNGITCAVVYNKRDKTCRMTDPALKLSFIKESV